MRDLGPNARNLIELARHEDEPDEAARERVQDALLARMKTGAAAGSLAPPGSPAAASNSAGSGPAARGDVEYLAAAKSQLGLKGSLAFVALLGAGGGFALYSQRPALLDSRGANGTSVTAPSAVTLGPSRSESARASQRTAEMAAALQPSAGGASSVPGKATAAEAPQPSERRSTARGSAGSAAPDTSSPERSAGQAAEARVPTRERDAVGAVSSAQAAQGVESAELADASRSEELLAEARALRDVQQALRAGDAPRALTLLAEQERRFAGGQLGAARAAARAMALCESQGAADRRSTAARFAALWPRSPLLPSVRTACSTESSANKRK